MNKTYTTCAFMGFEIFINKYVIGYKYENVLKVFKFYFVLNTFFSFFFQFVLKTFRNKLYTFKFGISQYLIILLEDIFLSTAEIFRT